MPCSYKKTNCPLYTLRSRAKLNVGGGGGRVDSSLCTSAVTSCVCSMSKKDVEQLVHSIMPKDLLKPPNVNFFSFSKSYGGSSFCVVQCLHQRSISYNTCKFIFQEEEEGLESEEDDEDQLNGNKAWKKTSKSLLSLSLNNAPQRFNRLKILEMSPIKAEKPTLVMRCIMSYSF